MKNECFRSTNEADFTFSQCSFRNEFTCDDGSCINKYKRCDDINDCDDASDENNCTIVKLEEDYRRGDPPKLSNNEINYLETTVEIKRIDSIDLNGIMTLTASITIRWKDPRMEFLNIRDKEFSSGDTDNVKVPKKVKKFILEYRFLCAGGFIIQAGSSVASSRQDCARERHHRRDQERGQLLRPCHR